TGTMQQLFDMYNAMANEIEADPALAPNIHLGCCGFTFNFLLNAFATQFMAAAEQADTRMDFIGYHPYSIGTPSGYDPGRTVIAAALRDLYRPNAELVNTEWGLLGGVDREQWADLDYGLAKVRSMIGMLDEGVEIATQAVLTDIFDDTSSTCCPGVVQLWPQVAIKNSTRPLIAMNMVRTATHRVGASSTDSAVVAGWTPGMDTLWVVATADTGIAPVQVQLSIADLPWASARIERFELTETTIDVWNGPTLVEDDVQTDVWGDTLVHTVDQGSGRLIIWRVTVAARVADASGFPSGASSTASTEPRRSGSRASAHSSARRGRPSGSCSHSSRKMRNTGTAGSIAYRFTRLFSVCLRAAAVRLPSTFSSTTTRA
ncbi:MAG TPA: hypothetical protein PL106_12400, partial [Flavobacteriales bacterium]|nr:hypothetical protein [Flavobacteriales bacterium]